MENFKYCQVALVSKAPLLPPHWHHLQESSHRWVIWRVRTRAHSIWDACAPPSVVVNSPSAYPGEELTSKVSP